MSPPTATRKTRRPPRRAPTTRTRTTGTGRLELEALLRLPVLYFPKLSWRRDRFAYYWDGSGRLELYDRSIDGDDVHQVSHGEVPRSLRWRPTWDRTDRWLVFNRDVGGNERFDLFRIARETGEVHQLTERPADSYPIEFSPDNRWILTLSNMAGKAGRAQLNLWRTPAEGGVPEQLTDYAAAVAFGGPGTVSWSPDGRRIAYGANETDDLRNQDVYICGADGSDARQVYRARIGSRDGPSAWHPDGRRIAIASDESGHYRPGLLNLAKESVQWYGDGARDETPLEFSRDGRFLLTQVMDGVEVYPRIYSVVSGRGRTVETRGGFVFDPELAADGRSVLTWYMSPVRRGEYVRLRPGAPPKTILAAEYGAVDRRALVTPRTVHYTTFDGRRIEALLSVPKSGSGARRPALIEVHGGPTAQFARDFGSETQYMVNHGFVVLQPNIRGSTGYGVEFQDLNRLDWGGGDLQDVIAGARYLRGLSFVDPDRLGIWGGSYGGFMTYLATVKEPEQWRAACAWVGITDLELLDAESREHYRYYLHEQMGDPKKNRDLWRDRSAIHFVDRLRAKLLIIHGTNDPRCPLDQASRFRDRLVELGRRPGVDFEYVELGEEGHGSADREQRIRSLRTLTEFFERTLGGAAAPAPA
jgi:dipeptidyl aminopeptidase/acylaminoacyl peptidase